MLGTPPQDKLQHLHISNACEHSWIMMIMVGSKMYKTEYDLKVIMYPAYDTPHKLCTIRGNWNIQQPRLPPNNADRPMRQFKCPLSSYPYKDNWGFCTQAWPVMNIQWTVNYELWLIGSFSTKRENLSLQKDIKICHYISFVLLLNPSLTSKFLSYALAVHDIQYNMFYSQLKCTMFENSVNCVTGQSAPFFIYRVFLHWLLCKIRKWGMSLTLVQYSLCSFWQMFVMVITFTYSSHASLSKIWCNFVLSGGITTDYITNHIK